MPRESIGRGFPPRPPPDGGSTSGHPTGRARQGGPHVSKALFERLRGFLRQWAHGRLPRWVRERGSTSANARTITEIGTFEPRRQQALEGYLRKTIMNRIADETRGAAHGRPAVSVDSLDPAAPSPMFDQAVYDENIGRYRTALERLDPADRELIVASLELGYTYEQVALATRRRSRDAARAEIRGALLRLAAEMISG